VQPWPLAQHKSLEEIARNAGVAVDQLESYISKFMVDISKEAPNSTREREYLLQSDTFTDILYNLHVLGNQTPLAVPWLQHLRGFDAFVAHFCPQANRATQAELIYIIKRFIRKVRPPMLLRNYELESSGRFDTGSAIYSNPGSWVKLPHCWVDKRVLEEALAWARTGIPKPEELFVHGTGTAAMESFAKHKAISSAALALKRGDKVRTGEYVSYIGRDGQTSTTGGATGLGGVYSSRNGLSSTSYTTQRWFDEVPVTFGISERKQRAYNEASGINLTYYNSQEGIVIGANVPFENIVAISAPKEYEERIRGWIGEHCRHARFVSYEAAELLEDEEMLDLLP
jgi:hypothetical protein